MALMAFESAARHLSFARAARDLNVTAGAISRQIQGLEGTLGRRLFARHHRRVELTPVGREYLAEVRAPLQRIARATARLRQEAGRGAISVCAYPTFAIRWLIPRWGRFYDRHPEIDLRLTTSLTAVDFARDDYDLAIQVAREGPHPAGLVQHKLQEVVLFPVCSPCIPSVLAFPKGCTAQSPFPSERAFFFVSRGLLGPSNAG